ncbi:MAG: hypothetical protein CVT92_15300 [Bacteroidetes bacterium HGW-Bacteroidetes-1]|jgi:ribosomal protein S18 acetylase RimI-like enzyme|nr:MAG: hypothetical protein CVT92_15300 [Bacteroidetes bacterium HGW-Bacteroidetes-1]
MPDIFYKKNQSKAGEILEHLVACDKEFTPPLSQRVDLSAYSEKMINFATNIEAWNDKTILVGLVSAYMNDPDNKTAYITSVSVCPDYTGKGIAKKLIAECLKEAKKNGFKQLQLEVNKSNLPAVNLYRSFGFEVFETNKETIKMSLIFKKDDTP